VTSRFRRTQKAPAPPRATMLRPRVVEAGDAALLAELPARIDPMTNGAVLRLAELVRAAGFRGVRDIVPAIRSLAVFFDPLHTDIEGLKAVVGRALESDSALEGRRHEVPVVYGGEAGVDLNEVAAASGLSAGEVISRHAGRDYRVYMLGFLPGFAYLGTLDPTIVAMRRPTSRRKVLAGTVGVAGRQTGIYPRESPGGWALLGRTPLGMFDPGSDTPARFAPGDVVRFVSVTESNWTNPASPAAVAHSVLEPAFEVRKAGLLTTVQDSGRWGHQRDGVSVSGAMDRISHRLANALVGNESSAASLELTMTGPELTCLRDTVVAVTGADLSARVNDQSVPGNLAVPLQAGATLTFGERRGGARGYVAFAGGIDVPLVLGSRATHLPSELGGLAGRALRTGDRLAVRHRGPLPSRRIARPVTRPVAGGVAVRVLPGPQAEAFPAEAMRQLLASRFVVSAESNRMGYRLKGASIAAPTEEMISDVTIPGAIQVPPSGDPILLMADRQTTGGYAQLAIVISADLPAAGQLAPGDWIAFELVSHAEAVSLLLEQERAMQHLEGHAFA
jgi:KipI family sensor histidine kinase inhibitor